MVGPLTGTAAVTGNRFTAIGKSPKTGCWGDANCGGTFGPALKFSGYDGILFVGKAKTPVYLLIDDGEVRLYSASPYWGNGADIEKAIKKNHGTDFEVAWIGVAGENKSLIAAIMNNEARAAARSGLGAVMGSKNLKAVAARGKKSVSIADSEGLKRYVVKAMNDAREANSPAYQLFTTFGTSGLPGGSAMNGDSPVKNWKSAGIVEFVDANKISDVAYNKYLLSRTGCWHCLSVCSGLLKVANGEFATDGPHTHRPEYETIAAFGSNLLVDEIEVIIKANDLCNHYGMDTIAAGGTIGFAMECFERGILTLKDTDGLDLSWGNGRAVIELIKLMAERRGIGGILEDGVPQLLRRLAEGPKSLLFTCTVRKELCTIRVSLLEWR
jgi:aldehyde:ferredoxin oxidoreductase